MPMRHQQLLDAIIGHLERLKEQGVRFVALTPQTLQGLGWPRSAAPGEAVVPPGAARSSASASARHAAIPLKNSTGAPESTRPLADTPVRSSTAADSLSLNHEAKE